MCYFKGWLSDDTLNSIYILVIKQSDLLEFCGGIFSLCLTTQTTSKAPIYCHYFNIDFVLWSWFVMHNFVFLEIPVFMLLDLGVKQEAAPSLGCAKIVTASHPWCSWLPSCPDTSHAQVGRGLPMHVGREACGLHTGRGKGCRRRHLSREGRKQIQDGISKTCSPTDCHFQESSRPHCQLWQLTLF